MYKNEMTSYY